MPIIDWASDYDRSWLGRDLLAGATVWAVLIPSALAYAGIGGVDPVVGLYTVPLALVAYAVLAARDSSSLDLMPRSPFFLPPPSSRWPAAATTRWTSQSPWRLSRERFISCSPCYVWAGSPT